MSPIKAKQVSEHLFRLELRFKLFGLVPFPVAAWLVRGAEGYALVDAGPSESGEELVQGLAELTEGRGVRAVLLTHGHADHAGGLGELRLAWNPTVACHPLEAPFVRGLRAYGRIPSRNVAFWLGELLMPAEAWVERQPQGLEQGQRIFGLEVLHMPGHTPGQLAFLHRQDRAMICGDVVMNVAGRLSGPAVIATPDLGQARRSIMRLSEWDFDHLLPSHGPPILNHGREALLAYLRRKMRGLFGQVP